MMKKYLLTLSFVVYSFIGIAQTPQVKEPILVSREFTDIINLNESAPESQGRAGVCWSFSTNSFFELELKKSGKEQVKLSRMYYARKQWEDKADAFVKMEGSLNWGEGGGSTDILYSYNKYGAVPESAYEGYLKGRDFNDTSELQSLLSTILQAVVKTAKEGPINPVWKKAVKSVLDAYMGEVPESFQYKGKTYTAKSFAEQVVKLNQYDYVSFMSDMNYPYWGKGVLLVPDNWRLDDMYNVEPTVLTDIIDNALKSGYSVAWGGDVSEAYFNWNKGLALVPENAEELIGAKISKDEKDILIDTVGNQLKITPEIRQTSIENHTTTDDHGMHIVGLAKDKSGEEFYIVKNSWGENNVYKGYLYMSKQYVQYKTTSILVNKNGIPSTVLKKINL